MATQLSLIAGDSMRPARDTAGAAYGYGVEAAAGRRFFVRCKDCLSVSVIVGGFERMDCGACDGRLELMGEVTRDGKAWQRRAVVSVCDDRCTNARGPCCDCSCGGKNHGSKRVMTVVRAEGSIPRLTPQRPGEARMIGEDYRAACAEAREAWGARYLHAVNAAGKGWVSPEMFATARSGRRILERLRIMEHGRTTKRAQALREYAQRIRDGRA